MTKLDILDRLAILATRAAAATSLALLSGCSLSFPLGPLTDNAPTSAILSTASPLSPELSREDWRIAEPVLARALQSDRSDAPAARWSNPASGHSGSFLPVASAFARDGKPCRVFVARVTIAGVSKMLQAVGCPGEAGDVVIDKVAPFAGV